MISLSDEEKVLFDRKSSKGNQNKWLLDGVWYKQDFLGYEGLCEYLVSRLIEKSNLSKFEFVRYSSEEIKYHNGLRKGCSSKNFLKEGDRLITIKRLFEKNLGKNIQTIVDAIDSDIDKIDYIVKQVVLFTGLKDFGKYLNVLFSIDALFLNEDRHFNNIALIIKENGEYDYCPIFDNSSALLSDIKNDYPLTDSIKDLIPKVKAKPFIKDFDKQLEYSSKLYGQNIIFDFSLDDVKKILNEDLYYEEEIKNRVLEIIEIQINKYYESLFRK